VTYPTATAADEFKLNFFTGVQQSFAASADFSEVAVTYGQPGNFAMGSNDIVAFRGVQSSHVDATIGPQRSRHETLTLEVVISCWRGGAEEMELVCAQRAYKILRAIEYYARVANTTLSDAAGNPAVLWCFLEQHQSDGATDPQMLEQGRVIEITATFKAEARVTGTSAPQ
jgi:hypothetical protein